MNQANALNCVVDTTGSNVKVSCYAAEVYVKTIDGRVFIFPNTKEGQIMFNNFSQDEWHGVGKIVPEPTEGMTPSETPEADES